MNNEYKNIRIAIIILLIICWTSFIILFILGYNSPSFKDSPFWDKIFPGFLYPIVTIPFTSFPLLILSIVLKKKNKKLHQSVDVKTEKAKKIIEVNRKIYRLGFITFIITFLPPFFILVFFVIGLYAWSTVM